ncbi:MAG: YqeG family HAD IIIA-type phosphatase [Clostridia bacterium]|nr:YqeG family HAD IIIA-type phosphatase [Clostridia bacterium]
MANIFVPKIMVPTVYDVDSNFLKKHNIKGIIYDVDNTLVGFKIRVPDEKLISHIEGLKNEGFKLFIISNNKKERVDEFNKSLGLSYIFRGMKPLWFSFFSAAKKMGLKRKEIVVVGDQIFTDVLGGNISSMLTVMVDPIDLKETFLFKLKRFLEKPFVKIYQRRNNK